MFMTDRWVKRYCHYRRTREKVMSTWGRFLWTMINEQKNDFKKISHLRNPSKCLLLLCSQKSGNEHHNRLFMISNYIYDCYLNYDINHCVVYCTSYYINGILTSVWCFARASLSWKSWPQAAQWEALVWEVFTCFFKISSLENPLLQIVQVCSPMLDSLDASIEDGSILFLDVLLSIWDAILDK